MKKRYALIATICCFATLTYAQNYRIGIAIGPHQSKVLEEKDVPGWDIMKDSYSPRTGVHFGFMANLSLNAKSTLFFQPSILYYNKGRKFAARYDTTVSDILSINATEHVNYLELPLNLVYKFRLSKTAKFIIGAGPYASFFYTGKTKTETVTKLGEYQVEENKDPGVGDDPDKYSVYDYGVNGLAGFEFGRVFLTANYSRGLNDAYTQPQGVTGTYKHEVMGITLGIFIDRLSKPEKPVTDKDNDGVFDKDDKCPEQAGLAKFNGCPDTDGDGIADSDDKCPGEAGLLSNQGCPTDRDKDGVSDNVDKCPDVAGVKENNGCPAVKDRDKDGILDEDDKCPDASGFARYDGCPVPDTDQDGINDEEDKCPGVKGTKERNGCPEEVKKEIVQKVNYAARRITFALGKATLLPSSNKVLDEVAAILKQNPDIIVSIEGHTSGDANFDANMKLSEDRANKVRAYLISKGIKASRLTAIGYGPTRPLTKGKTEAEKAKNRRVELKLSNQ